MALQGYALSDVRAQIDHSFCKSLSERAALQASEASFAEGAARSAAGGRGGGRGGMCLWDSEAVASKSDSEIYIDATGSDWVCMYTSINIVSRPVSF